MRRIIAIALGVFVPVLALGASLPPLVTKNGQTQQLQPSDSLRLPNVTGSVQCLHADLAGNVTGASSTDCAAGANPGATASDTAVNGSATTYMRSDAAPAVQKASASQFGVVRVDGTTIAASGGVISSVGGATGANPSATAGPAAVNGSAATFMRSDAAPAVQQGSASQKGIVQVDGTTITASGGVISAVTGAIGSGSWFSPTMKRMTYVSVPNGSWAADGDSVSVFGTAGGTGGTGFAYGWSPGVGTVTGISGSAWYQLNSLNSIQAYFSGGLGPATNVRCWIALTDSLGASFGASDTPSGNFIGFRFSTAAGDTHWQAITQLTNTSSTTKVDTGISVNTSVQQQFAVIATTTSVLFYIDGNLVATTTTNIPAGVKMRYAMSAEGVGSTGAEFFANRIYIFTEGIS